MTAERKQDSEMLKAAGKTFFFDIKETQDGKPYLVITESRLKGDGEKPRRSSIMIFPDDLKGFVEKVTLMAEKIAGTN